MSHNQAGVLQGSHSVRRTVDALGIAVLVLLCALWGLQQVAIKQAVTEGLAPFFQAAVRSTGAAFLVCLWMTVRGDGHALARLWRSPAKGWPGLLLGSIFAGEFLLLYPGLRLTSASRGVLFLYTAPFFTALGAHVFLPGERLRSRQALGLVVAFAGVAAAFADGLAHGGGNAMGDTMCGLAALGWGANTVLVRAVPALRATPPAGLLLFQLGGSAPILWAACWLAGDLDHTIIASTLAWGSLFYQTVIVAFASYLAWFWLVTLYPPTQVSGFTFLTPLFGILAGALLLGEHASSVLFIGLAAIGVGLRLLR